MDPSAIRNPQSAIDLSPPWRRILLFADLDSTQLEAGRRLAAGEDLGGVVLRAERQLAGRGRLDHAWISEAGGLYVTAALPYDLALRPSDVGWISIVAALAAAETLIQDWNFDVRIKWPNDLILDGRKIGGILGEVKSIPQPKNPPECLTQSVECGSLLPLSPSSPSQNPPERLTQSVECGSLLPLSLANARPTRQILIGLGLNWVNRVTATAASAATTTNASSSAPPGSLIDFRPNLPAAGRDAFLLGWLDRLNVWHTRLRRDYNTGLGMLGRGVETILWRRGELVELKHTERGPLQGRLLGLGRGAAARLETAPGQVIEAHCGWQAE